MKQLGAYFKLQQEIYEYFGYREDWAVIPLQDYTEHYWDVDDTTVFFADSEAELEEQDGQYFEHRIYTQRFLPKWVYEGEDYTMICSDTQTDGNKFLAVFDNSKKRHKPNRQDYVTIHAGELL